jgi:hypothetical protein
MVRSPINVLPTGCQPFPITVFFLLASIRRQMRRSSRRRTYTPLVCNASSLSPMASWGILSLSTTPSWSKNHPWVQPSPCVHKTQWPTRPHCAARNRASLGQATNYVRDAEMGAQDGIGTRCGTEKGARIIFCMIH